MAVGTTTTGAKALKQYWHDFFISNLYDTLALQGLTKKAKVGKGQGKTVWWVGIPVTTPAGTTLSEGADPTARSANATRISGTLAEYGKLIKNSRLFMDTSIDGYKEELMKNLAQDAAKTLDDAVLAKALAGGTAMYAKGKLHRSGVIEACTATIEEVRKAVRLLKLSSVPRFADGFYAGLVHPDVAFDLQSDSKWQDIVKYRDSVKYDIPGEIGRIWGVRFAECPTIPVLTNSGSASTDVYRTLIFGQDFIGQSELGELEIVINEPGRASELKQFNTYGYRFVMASEVLSDQKGIRLETSASLA